MSSGRSLASAGVSDGAPAADCPEHAELVASHGDLRDERAEVGPMRDHVVRVRQEALGPRGVTEPHRAPSEQKVGLQREDGHRVREAGVDRRRLLRARSRADRVALHERDTRTDRVGQHARGVALERALLHDAPRCGRLRRRAGDVAELERDDRDLRMRERPCDRDPHLAGSLGGETEGTRRRHELPSAHVGEPGEQRRVGAPAAGSRKEQRKPARHPPACARPPLAPSWRRAVRGSLPARDPRSRLRPPAPPHRSTAPLRPGAAPPHGTRLRARPRSGSVRVRRARRTTRSRHGPRSPAHRSRWPARSGRSTRRRDRRDSLRSRTSRPGR